ncbi:hypothetical protein Syun_006921 [Stephania yunnanensis]|uniref:Uncharacterized protein n=1 Tax=Stephania yunnanensis TaxID=152371 RepID=A0AAP0KYI9_9MAGN
MRGEGNERETAYEEAEGDRGEDKVDFSLLKVFTILWVQGCALRARVTDTLHHILTAASALAGDRTRDAGGSRQPERQHKASATNHGPSRQHHKATSHSAIPSSRTAFRQYKASATNHGPPRQHHKATAFEFDSIKFIASRVNGKNQHAPEQMSLNVTLFPAQHPFLTIGADTLNSRMWKQDGPCLGSISWEVNGCELEIAMYFSYVLDVFIYNIYVEVDVTISINM